MTATELKASAQCLRRETEAKQAYANALDAETDAKVSRGCFDKDGVPLPEMARQEVCLMLMDRDCAHRCPWPGCERMVPRLMWGCRTHWCRLPGDLRMRIGRAYRYGLDIHTHPTHQYVEAHRAALDWIRDSGPIASHEPDAIPECPPHERNQASQHRERGD
jgi:hypothetical protein